MRASSCASTTTRRALSVNRSNMSSLLVYLVKSRPRHCSPERTTVVEHPWNRGDWGTTPGSTTGRGRVFPDRGSLAANTGRGPAERESSVRGGVRLADLGGDPA